MPTGNWTWPRKVGQSPHEILLENQMIQPPYKCNWKNQFPYSNRTRMDSTPPQFLFFKYISDHRKNGLNTRLPFKGNQSNHGTQKFCLFIFFLLSRYSLSSFTTLRDYDKSRWFVNFFFGYIKVVQPRVEKCSP